MTNTPPRRPARYGLLGVGFGPSHLSLAAVCDSTREPAVRARVHCLEARPGFGWHPDMLLDGTRMQVAFLKDLVSPHDPTSPYSFTNYLVSKGRLEQFLNLGTLHPTRREYADYFGWAADRLSHHVSYGCVVEGVRPVTGADGDVTHLEVSYRDLAGDTYAVAADHVSLAPGGRPVVPPGVEREALDSGTVFHSSTFLPRVRRFHQRGREAPHRFLVVGAGQSAAEVFQYLAREFPAADVTLAHRGFALMPANSSPLANEIFDPGTVDLFHSAGAARRRTLLAELHSTNYAAVDDQDIHAIAELLYEQRVHGRHRLRLCRFTELADCRADGPLALVTLRDPVTGQSLGSRFDGVVLATGYDFREAGDLLAGLEPHLLRDTDGTLRIRRDYSVETAPGFRPRVFLHGAAEHTHGLSSTLLSVLAHRAAHILDTAFGPRPGTAGARAPLVPDALEGADA
ncbi:lysine N(6)-hydroxylase/L-ornithine N(5)-oxygenase family protein [Streptomyces sp. URMC 126]|uniref:lysine N(6)-hydroxylase/L-ornithine N(5)-oxygenase family protein n=1 Tax=Streptomyces sp. URMC 126 TaxID=3423401 RepID=UPI003F1DF283